MVPYDRNGFSRMYEESMQISVERAMSSYGDDSNVSGCLQTLLQRVCETNKTNHTRVSHGDFLAALLQGPEDLAVIGLESSKASIHNTIA